MSRIFRCSIAISRQRFAAGFLAAAVAMPGAAWAQQPMRIDAAGAAQTVEVASGHSSLLEFTAPIQRASVNDVAVADVVVVSPTELLVQGRQPGSTSLLVWRDGVNEIYEVSVRPNLEALKKAVQEVFPGEAIRVHNATGVVILAGIVSGKSVISDAQRLAETYSGEDKVVNLLSMRERPLQQVLKELFPDEDITVMETAEGIVLSGSIKDPAVATRAGEVATLYSENVKNLLGPDTTSFASLLHQIVPGEDFTVHEIRDRDAIILAGKAKHPANLKKAAEAATVHAANVINLVDVPDQKQVMIEVRFLEARRTFTHAFGFNYWLQAPDASAGSFTGSPLQVQTPATPQFMRVADEQDLLVTDALQQLFEYRGGTDITAALQLLETEGLIRILAEPNLLTMSGEKASFLAGGEFPIPVVQGATGTVTIEFKEFGVNLDFTPEVTSDDVIKMTVAPEVSVLDFGSAAVTIGGFDVPGLITRRAETIVQMRPGESLIIGGLLSQNDNKTENKVPYLSSLPVIGKLFTSESFRNDETELIVIVTPRLKAPQDLQTAERFPDSELVNEAIQGQLGDAPYYEERADAIKQAITGVRVERPKPEPFGEWYPLEEPQKERVMVHPQSVMDAAASPEFAQRGAGGTGSPQSVLDPGAGALRPLAAPEAGGVAEQQAAGTPVEAMDRALQPSPGAAQSQVQPPALKQESVLPAIPGTRSAAELQMAEPGAAPAAGQAPAPEGAAIAPSPATGEPAAAAQIEGAPSAAEGAAIPAVDPSVFERYEQDKIGEALSLVDEAEATLRGALPEGAAGGFPREQDSSVMCAPGGAAAGLPAVLPKGFIWGSRAL